MTSGPGAKAEGGSMWPWSVGASNFINLLSSHTSVRKTLPDNYMYVNQKVSYKSCEFHVPWNIGNGL